MNNPFYLWSLTVLLSIANNEQIILPVEKDCNVSLSSCLMASITYNSCLAALHCYSHRYNFACNLPADHWSKYICNDTEGKQTVIRMVNNMYKLYSQTPVMLNTKAFVTYTSNPSWSKGRELLSDWFSNRVSPIRSSTISATSFDQSQFFMPAYYW